MSILTGLELVGLTAEKNYLAFPVWGHYSHFYHCTILALQRRQHTAYRASRSQAGLESLDVYNGDDPYTSNELNT